MRFPRMFAALLLAVYLPACTAYHQTETPLTQLTAPPKPVERVRVTAVDGRQLEVWGPRTERDSVIRMGCGAGQGDRWSFRCAGGPPCR
jgi:hypothetical protein